MSGSKARLAAGAALVLIFAVGSGCRRPDCAVPDDVSGTWNGEARDSRGERFPLQLSLVQAGDDIGGNYSFGRVTRGLYGLRIDRRVEFDTDPLSDCVKRLRGVARFCGESLDLTLDGEDCTGDYHATATLRRTSDVPAAVAGSSGATQGSAGIGSPAAGSGAAGRSPQPTPPCYWVNNGRCDEPEGTDLCPEGTDAVDCTRTVRPCAYQKDGACDEPEGTGLCDEGQDPDDCKQATVCGGQICKGPDPLIGLPGNGTRACCIENTRCGLSFASGPCFEITPGVKDASCSQALAPFVPINIASGCCRPDGLCGLAPASAELGCVLPESLGMPFAGAGRIACGREDLDAGAP